MFLKSHNGQSLCWGLGPWGPSKYVPMGTLKGLTIKRAEPNQWTADYISGLRGQGRLPGSDLLGSNDSHVGIMTFHKIIMELEFFCRLMMSLS